MIQIDYSVDVVSNLNTDISNSASSNLKKNETNKLIRKHGWFPKSKSIMKFLNVQIGKNNNLNEERISTARCFECYNLVKFKDIKYSRIICNYNSNANIISDCSGNNSISNNNISDSEFSNTKNDKISCFSEFEKYYKLSVICSKCISNKIDFKNAPHTFGDIIADFIINNRLDIFTEDLGNIANQKITDLNDSIVSILFNYNEKQIMLNHIIKENARLKCNLDIEIEKHKILSEYKSKNRELQESLKNHLLQSSHDLFKTHKQIIDAQIAKYNEYNNSTQYNIPECRICMLQEVSITLECGHLLCLGCHDKMQADTRNKLVENADDDASSDENELLHVDGYPCPFCKILSSKFIKIFL